MLRDRAPASQSDFHNFCPLAIFQIFTTLSLLTLVVPLQSDTMQGRRWTEDFVTSAGRFIAVAAFLLQQGMVQFYITTATDSFVAYPWMQMAFTHFHTWIWNIRRRIWLTQGTRCFKFIHANMFFWYLKNYQRFDFWKTGHVHGISQTICRICFYLQKDLYFFREICN